MDAPGSSAQPRPQSTAILSAQEDEQSGAGCSLPVEGGELLEALMLLRGGWAAPRAARPARIPGSAAGAGKFGPQLGIAEVLYRNKTTGGGEQNAGKGRGG